MKKYILTVDGMMCGMCEAHVNNAVRNAANVESVSSSHSAGRTEIVCDENVDIEAIKAAIEKDGYHVTAVTEDDGTQKKARLFSKLFGKK